MNMKTTSTTILVLYLALASISSCNHSPEYVEPYTSHTQTTPDSTDIPDGFVIVEYDNGQYLVPDTWVNFEDGSINSEFLYMKRNIKSTLKINRPVSVPVSDSVPEDCSVVEYNGKKYFIPTCLIDFKGWDSRLEKY